MEITFLPISGNIPTYYIAHQKPFKMKNETQQKLVKSIRSTGVFVQIFPPQDDKIEDSTAVLRANDTPLTLQEFYQQVSGMSQDSLILIVRFDSQTNEYYINKREIPYRLDYDIDKNRLEFASAEPNDCEFTNVKIIEYSQIASAIGVNREGEAYMFRRQNVRQIPVPGNTPMYINTVFYGLKQIDNIVTFTGHKGISNEQQSYIGLVIYD